MLCKTEVLSTMSFISRGFRGRTRDQADAARLPPGQYLERDFPVLSAGPTPRIAHADWTFSITGEVDAPKKWIWDEFRKLPTETITKDIHCVTKWSKLDTVWKGVSVDTLLAVAQPRPDASHVLAFSSTGYTNPDLEECSWHRYISTERRWLSRWRGSIGSGHSRAALRSPCTTFWALR